MRLEELTKRIFSDSPKTPIDRQIVLEIKRVYRLRAWSPPAQERFVAASDATALENAWLGLGKDGALTVLLKALGLSD